MKRQGPGALKLAIAAARAEDAGRARQIDSMLKERPRIEVGKFCASVAQSRSLRLAPWEIAPVDLLPGDLSDPRPQGARAAYALLSAWSVAAFRNIIPIRSLRLSRPSAPHEKGIPAQRGQRATAPRG